MSKIVIEIDKTGKAKMSVEGGVGSQCLDLTKNYENLFGQVQENTREITEELDDIKVRLND